MSKKFSKKLFIILVFNLLLFILVIADVRAGGVSGSWADDSMPFQWKMPDLQIKIPGLEKFFPPECAGDAKNRVCKIYWISEYIGAIYKYAIGVAGILAAVMLMIGGIIWLTAGGNQTRIGTAKSYIGASLTGLIIALSSYLILYQINPELIKLKPIIIGMVSELEEVQKQFAAQGCPTDEEKSKGFQAFITGYCKPHPAGYTYNKKNFYVM